MRITILPLALFMAAFFLGGCSNTVFAQEATASARQADIGYSRIHPASSFYFLKGIREKLEMALAQTERVRNLRQLEFATRRLREVRTLVAIRQEELIPATVERYMAHLGSLTDKHQENDPFADILKNNLSVHLQVLQQIYAATANLRSKLFLRSAMNRIIQRADVDALARVSICEFFSREASSSALNQTEQVVLKSRAAKCFE